MFTNNYIQESSFAVIIKACVCDPLTQAQVEAGTTK